MHNNVEMHWSGLITELAKLDRADLEARFTDRELVRKVLDSIAEIDENMEYPKDLDRNSFPDLIYELYEIKHYWGRRITAERVESIDKRDIGIMNRFIQDCPSPYYRKLAQEHLQKLK